MYIGFLFQSYSNRIFWKVSLLVVTCMFIFLCYEMIDKFLLDQTWIRMSKRQVKVDEIPFPAITFCPDLVYIGHNISPDLNLLGILDYQVPLATYSLPIWGNTYQQFYEEFNLSAESLIPELRRRTQMKWFTNCVLIDWMGQYSVTTKLVLTRHGFCFSFNMQPIETLLHMDK